MKFINLFARALVATTAANVLLASDAYACDKCTALDSPPNGWTEMGQGCVRDGSDGETYYKLRKNSDHSLYGVYKKNRTWATSKDLTLKQVNTKMNNFCGVYSY